MKTLFTRFVLLGVLLLSTLTASAAYDAYIDGIYYNFNTSNKTASVTSGSNKYVGNVVIPFSVLYNEETYSVTSIEDYAFSGCSSLTSINIPNSVTSIGGYAFKGCSSLTSVTIPNSVTNIEYYAFGECANVKELIYADGCTTTLRTYLTSLTSVTIPNTVTSIGDWAFSGCNSLTSVTIPNIVTSIGVSAFDGCSSLTSITIPNSVTSIGSWAFNGCSSLTSLTIPNSVTYIGIGGFGGCANVKELIYADGCTTTLKTYLTSLTSVTIPNSVTSIGGAAFSDCSSLTSITIPNSVTSIGDLAFRYCSSLTSVIIPNSVTSIGDRAFYLCSSLTSVTIPNSVTSIGESAFSGCSSLPVIDGYRYADTYLVEVIDKSVTSINIKDGIRFIGSYAFSGCSSLTSVTIPNSVASIGYEAFYNCSSLTSITIPNSVTSIDDEAFYNCSSLTSITIPNSVTSIGDWAFDGCYLKDVMVKNEQPASTSEDTFSDRSYQHASLYVPAGSWMEYVYDENSYWYKFNKIYETAQSLEAAEQAKAYMLMDDKFGYAVYDPINDKVVNVSSTSVDGSNPNHAWMLTEVQGKKYLYNLGAKKFAVPSTDGTAFTLSVEPAPISAADGENGIILNGHNERQWNLTDRAQMGGLDDFEEIVTAINSVSSNGANIVETYTLDGKRTTTPQRGVRIIRYSDGTTKKVM